MPTDKLEQHPYIAYINDHLVKNKKYKGLIIGSFPIYACTDSINDQFEVIESRFDKKIVDMRFFYGSKKSKFWHYSSSAFGHSIDANIDSNKTIEFLNQNDLIIADALFRVNRKDTSSADADLWVYNKDLWLLEHLKLNKNIRSILNEHTSINNIFFTSQDRTPKSPFGWFKEIFGDDLQEVSNHKFGCVCLINNIKYNCFFLPTPKPRALHFTDKQRTEMFINFIASKDKSFCEEISKTKKADRTSAQIKKLSDLRTQCLVEAYKQAFVFNNIDFDGKV